MPIEILDEQADWRATQKKLMEIRRRFLRSVHSVHVADQNLTCNASRIRKVDEEYLSKRPRGRFVAEARRQLGLVR